MRKKIFKHSYNYQDIFALLCLNDGKLDSNKSGTFVDIGCHYSNNISNVKLLLENSWTGIGFDIDHKILPSWEEFQNKIEIFICDVMNHMSTINKKINQLPSVIDYLNIDLDGYPCQYAVENLDFNNKKYRCITVEHDEYRFGDVYKKPQRKILESLGYEIVVKNAAEDWYVFPDLINENFLKVLKNVPKNYVQCDSNIDEICKYLNIS